MTFSGVFEIVLTLGLTVATAYPIGAYMADPERPSPAIVAGEVHTTDGGGRFQR